MSHEERVRNIEKVWLIVSELNKNNISVTPYVIIKHAVSILGVTTITAESYLDSLYKGHIAGKKVIYVERCKDGITARERG